MFWGYFSFPCNLSQNGFEFFLPFFIKSAPHVWGYRRYAMVLRLKKEAFTVRLSRLYSARRAPCKHDRP